MNPTINIAVVDDEVLFRKSIVFLLNEERNINIVFDGNNGQELIDYLKNNRSHPDIVLMDIRMPVLNGIDTSKIISEKYPHINIVIVSSLDSDHFIEQMIQYGASSYIIKNSDPEEVVNTIHQVHKHGIYFPPHMLNLIISNKRFSNNANKDATKELSEREVEVLNLICLQLNTKEIANRLCISERTVEGHRQNMLEKTKSKNVVGLILYGIKHNLLSIT